MNLDAALALLAKDAAAPLDIAELALHLARDEYPNLDVDACLCEVDAIAHEGRSYVRGDLEAQVHGLCRYLFHEMGFRGNAREYYDPRNSYFNQVLERRTGIPISLSAVAMAVGRRLGLEVQGVGLPGHFVVKVVGQESEFFVDPFHGGRRLSPTECAILVEQVTGREFAATPESLAALPLQPMVQRMLGNLKGVYLQEEDYGRAIRVMRRLRQLDPLDPMLRRDLGIVYLRHEQPGKALDHLHAYLAALPQAADAADVHKLLHQAKGQLAGLN